MSLFSQFSASLGKTQALANVILYRAGKKLHARFKIGIQQRFSIFAHYQINIRYKMGLSESVAS